MIKEINSLLGPLFFVVLFGWAAIHSWTYLKRHIRRESAVDQNLCEIDRSDAPKLYWGQLIAYLNLLIISVVVALFALVQLIKLFF